MSTHSYIIKSFPDAINEIYFLQRLPFYKGCAFTYLKGLFILFNTAEGKSSHLHFNFLMFFFFDISKIYKMS